MITEVIVEDPGLYIILQLNLQKVLYFFLHFFLQHRAGNFYAALEGTAFQRITTPWCLSQHPNSPLTTEEVLELARLPLEPKG